MSTHSDESDDESLLEKKKAKLQKYIKQQKPKKEVVMTWGKYKGKFIKDILQFDEKYAAWVYRQEFIKKFEDVYKALDEHFMENSIVSTFKKL